MAKQSENYHLSIAGELYVAAELNRRGVHASLTYGNAKKADVVAFTSDGSRAVIIEVKSTGQRKWLVGETVPEASDSPWVFVYVPDDPSRAPQFFVLTQKELCNVLTPKKEAWFKEHPAYAKACLWNLTRDEAACFEARWDKITQQIRSSTIPSMSSRLDERVKAAAAAGEAFEGKMRTAKVVSVEPIVAGTGYWGRAEGEFANAVAHERDPKRKKEMLRGYEAMAEQLKGKGRSERERILLKAIANWRKV